MAWKSVEKAQAPLSSQTQPSLAAVSFLWSVFDNSLTSVMLLFYLFFFFNAAVLKRNTDSWFVSKEKDSPAQASPHQINPGEVP